MRNLPEGWIITELHELGASIRYPIGDGDHGQIKPSCYMSSGVPYIRVADLGWGKFLPKGMVYIPEDVHVKNLKSELMPGDILIAKTGATIGKCCIVPDHIQRANTTSSIGKVTIDKTITLPEWILYYFLSQEFRDKMWSVSEKTAQPGFSNRELKRFSIPIAPLSEQRRIVAKLEKLLQKVDACTDRLDKIPAILKRFRQSILAAACSGQLTEDWREKNPDVEHAVKFLKRIKEKRRIAYIRKLEQSKKKKTKKPTKDYEFRIIEENSFIQGWATVKLENLIYIAARIGWRGLKAEEYTKEGPFFLSVHSLNYGEEIDFRGALHISIERYNESKEIMLQEDDILLAKDGAGIGKIGIVKNLTTQATINSSLLVIRSLEAFLAKYLFYFLSGPEFQNIAKEKITGSATPHLFQKDIRKFTLSVPPLEEQYEIVRRVEALFKIADQIEKRYIKARDYIDKLTQSILAKAFRGELVRQDPNDEPASELLKRIKVGLAKNMAKKKTGRLTK
jgi:type I restriction enzyme, S subunit